MLLLEEMRLKNTYKITRRESRITQHLYGVLAVEFPSTNSGEQQLQASRLAVIRLTNTVVSVNPTQRSEKRGCKQGLQLQKHSEFCKSVEKCGILDKHALHNARLHLLPRQKRYHPLPLHCYHFLMIICEARNLLSFYLLWMRSSRTHCLTPNECHNKSVHIKPAHTNSGLQNCAHICRNFLNM